MPYTPSGYTANEALAAAFDPSASGFRISGSGGSSIGGGASVYSNAQLDFIATANSGTKTITLSAIASSVLSANLAATNFLIAVIKRVSSTGAVDTLPITKVSYSAGVLTLTDMAANFAVGDIVFVAIIGPDKDPKLIAGEDLVTNRLQVEQRFNYQNISTAATTTVKSGAGLVKGIYIANPGATSNTIKAYDNTAASGTVIADLSTSGGAPAQGYVSLDALFSTGLTIVTAGTTSPNITAIYR